MKKETEDVARMIEESDAYFLIGVKNSIHFTIVGSKDPDQNQMDVITSITQGMLSAAQHYMEVSIKKQHPSNNALPLVLFGEYWPKIKEKLNFNVKPKP